MSEIAMPEGVSVLIAVRLPAPYLGAALQSLSDQTRRPDEVVLVAHGCAAEVRSQMGDLPGVEVRILDAPPDWSLAQVRTFGLREARFEFVAVLDSDDVALPQRLARQSRSLEQYPAAVLAAGPIELIDAAGVAHGTSYHHPPASDLRRALLQRNHIAHSTVMYRRAAAVRIAGYREVPLAEDYDLWLRLSCEGDVLFDDQANTQYRVHDLQLTHARHVPRESWAMLWTSRRDLGRVLGVPRVVVAAMHAAWVLVQLRPRRAMVEN